MSIPWPVVTVVLLLALIVVLTLWIRDRGRTRHELDADSDELRQMETEIETLERQLQAIEGRSYLSEFTADTVYRLLSKAEVSWHGTTRTHGIVELENGRILPFVVDETMSDLKPEHVFSSVRGQLVRLNEGVFGIAPAEGASKGVDLDVTQPVETASILEELSENEFTEPEVAEPEELDSDRTMMFRPGQDLPKIPADATAGLPHLAVEKGVDESSVFHLPFARVTLGRDKSNDICLNEGGSSRVHCSIAFDRIRFVLRDESSTNDTLLNGEKVTEHWLEFGDRIAIADTEMVFSCKGYDLRDEDPNGAIDAFQATLERSPDFLTALKVQAFLLERNIARKKEAAPLWKKIAALERS